MQGKRHTFLCAPHTFCMILVIIRTAIIFVVLLIVILVAKPTGLFGEKATDKV